MALFSLIYKTVRNIATAAGFNLVLTKRSKKGMSYEQISPVATYAPWLSDYLFNDTYKIAKNYTLVDEYRCYELWQLIEETAKLDEALIEVGVWRGGSGALIAKKQNLTESKIRYIYAILLQVSLKQAIKIQIIKEANMPTLQKKPWKN